MKITETDLGLKMTAENEVENRLVNAVSEIMWNNAAGDYSEDVLNAHGCITLRDPSGNINAVFNYVTVPDEVL